MAVIYEGLRYKQNPGHRYTVCSVCKKIWNTDLYLQVPAEKYKCPHCVHRERMEKIKSEKEE